jgi:dodecin
MSVLKVIEVLAQSEESWEHAAQTAIDEAAKTVENISSIYIKEMKATIQNNKINNYQINAKISFHIKGS